MNRDRFAYIFITPRGDLKAPSTIATVDMKSVSLEEMQPHTNANIFSRSFLNVDENTYYYTLITTPSKPS